MDSDSDDDDSAVMVYAKRERDPYTDPHKNLANVGGKYLRDVYSSEQSQFDTAYKCMVSDLRVLTDPNWFPKDRVCDTGYVKRNHYRKDRNTGIIYWDDPMN